MPAVWRAQGLQLQNRALDSFRYRGVFVCLLHSGFLFSTERRTKQTSSGW